VYQAAAAAAAGTTVIVKNKRGRRIVVNGEIFWTFQIKAWLSVLALSVKGRKKLVSEFNLVYILSDLVGENERIW